jgi:hypothetical protein
VTLDEIQALCADFSRDEWELSLLPDGCLKLCSYAGPLGYHDEKIIAAARTLMPRLAAVAMLAKEAATLGVWIDERHYLPGVDRDTRTRLRDAIAALEAP